MELCNLMSKMRVSSEFPRRSTLWDQKPRETLEMAKNNRLEAFMWPAILVAPYALPPEEEDLNGVQFTDLPVEMHDCIADYLDGFEHFVLSHVCQKFLAIYRPRTLQTLQVIIADKETLLKTRPRRRLCRGPNSSLVAGMPPYVDYWRCVPMDILENPKRYSWLWTHSVRRIVFSGYGSWNFGDACTQLLKWKLPEPIFSSLQRVCFFPPLSENAAAELFESPLYKSIAPFNSRRWNRISRSICEARRSHLELSLQIVSLARDQLTTLVFANVTDLEIASFIVGPFVLPKKVQMPHLRKLTLTALCGSVAEHLMDRFNNFPRLEVLALGIFGFLVRKTIKVQASMVRRLLNLPHTIETMHLMITKAPHQVYHTAGELFPNESMREFRTPVARLQLLEEELREAVEEVVANNRWYLENSQIPLEHLAEATIDWERDIFPRDTTIPNEMVRVAELARKLEGCMQNSLEDKSLRGKVVELPQVGRLSFDSMFSTDRFPWHLFSFPNLKNLELLNNFYDAGVQHLLGLPVQPHLRDCDPCFDEEEEHDCDILQAQLVTMVPQLANWRRSQDPVVQIRYYMRMIELDHGQRLRLDHSLVVRQFCATVVFLSVPVSALDSHALLEALPQCCALARLSVDIKPFVSRFPGHFGERACTVYDMKNWPNVEQDLAPVLRDPVRYLCGCAWAAARGRAEEGLSALPPPLRDSATACVTDVATVAAAAPMDELCRTIAFYEALVATVNTRMPGLAYFRLRILESFMPLHHFAVLVRHNVSLAQVLVQVPERLGPGGLSAGDEVVLTRRSGAYPRAEYMAYGNYGEEGAFGFVLYDLKCRRNIARDFNEGEVITKERFSSNGFTGWL